MSTSERLRRQEEYAAKLLDKRWLDKRAQILERDENKCRHCGTESKGLNVHHIKYVGDPWECYDAFLITLCFDCHSKAEDAKVMMYYFYKVMMDRNFTKDEIGTFLEGFENIRIISEREIFFKALEWLMQDSEQMELMIENYKLQNLLQ